MYEQCARTRTERHQRESTAYRRSFFPGHFYRSLTPCWQFPQKYACCAFLIAGKPSDFLCSTFLLCNKFFFTHHTRVSKSNNTKENIRWSAYQLGDDAEGWITAVPVIRVKNALLGIIERLHLLYIICVDVDCFFDQHLLHVKCQLEMKLFLLGGKIITPEKRIMR